jgi:ribosome-binding factor A
MKHHRPERIAEVLKEEITEIINYELDDRRIRPAVVTHLKVSADMRHARVYVTLTGPPDQVQQTVDALNHAAEYVRSQLYPRLYLRAVPHLTFAYDNALEAAMRIEQLLAEVRSADPEPPDGGVC